MADLKISQLTAITTLTPATDVLPVVDVTGTTKKITTNQILGSGGTATLASATISGDLTVDTSTLYVSSSTDKVCVGTTSPSGEKLTVAGNVSANAWVGRGNIAAPSGDCSIFRSADNTLSFGIASTTAMTLNSTGLGVGVSPSYKLDVTDNSTNIQARLNSSNNNGTSLRFVNTGTSGRTWQIGTGFAVTAGHFEIYDATAAANRLSIDSSGNVGIGVTPSASWNSGGNIQVGTLGALYTNATLGATDLAYNSIRTGTDTYQYLFGSSVAASRFQQRDGSFRFFTAPAGTSPNAITFTERLRLKETGQLRFMPLAADPSGAEAGDVYYNSSSNKLKCYNGSTWNDLF